MFWSLVLPSTDEGFSRSLENIPPHYPGNKNRLAIWDLRGSAETLPNRMLMAQRVRCLGADRFVPARVELDKSLRETEDYLNEMSGVLACSISTKYPTTVRSVGGNKTIRCGSYTACSALRRNRLADVVWQPSTQVASSEIKQATTIAAARITCSSRKNDNLNRWGFFDY